MGTSRLEEREVLSKLLEDQQLYHDEYQILYCIIGESGHGNVFGMYQQCLRELAARKQTLIKHRSSRFLLTAEIEYSRNCVRKWVFTAKQKLRRAEAVAELSGRLVSLETLVQQTKHVEREMAIMLKVANACKENIGPINEQTRPQLSRGMWIAKMRKCIKVSIVCNGRVDAGMLEGLLHVPDDIFVEILTAFPKDTHSMIGALREGLLAFNDGRIVEQQCMAPKLVQSEEHPLLKKYPIGSAASGWQKVTG